jgi:hypothetical protein
LSLLAVVVTLPWCWCGAQGPPRPPEAAPASGPSH